ncbi:MAG: RNA-directed DNA polymerase [Saprospiraceae bacterium]
MITFLTQFIHQPSFILNSIFTIHDLKNAIPKIGKGHPFLPDRKWLEENLEENLEGKLYEILNEINQNGWSFNSIENYNEWQEKAIPAIKMSTPDWLVHFAILEKIEKKIQQFFIPNTAFQISKMDELIDQCKLWKKENPTAWVLQTDIKSFFKNIRHDLLLERLESKLSSQVFNILKQYLNATLKSTEDLEKKGMAIGAELNYLLASAYLLPIDAAIFHSEKVIHYARYVDDILIFCQDEKESREVQKMIELELEKIGLGLNFSKTKIQNVEEDILFLRQLL